MITVGGHSHTHEKKTDRREGKNHHFNIDRQSHNFFVVQIWVKLYIYYEINMLGIYTCSPGEFDLVAYAKLFWKEDTCGRKKHK